MEIQANGASSKAHNSMGIEILNIIIRYMAQQDVARFAKIKEKNWEHFTLAGSRVGVE